MVMQGPTPQSTLPRGAFYHNTTFGRPSLRVALAKQKNTFRHERRGATFFALGTTEADDTAAPNSISKIVPEDPFYNRLAEQKRFKNMFNSKPSAVTVLLGPPNCGKTVR